MPSGGDSYSLHEGCHYSSLPPTLYKVDEGMQCDMRNGAEQLESRNQDENEDEYEGEVENKCL